MNSHKRKASEKDSSPPKHKKCRKAASEHASKKAEISEDENQFIVNVNREVENNNSSSQGNEENYLDEALIPPDTLFKRTGGLFLVSDLKVDQGIYQGSVIDKNREIKRHGLGAYASHDRKITCEGRWDDDMLHGSDCIYIEQTEDIKKHYSYKKYSGVFSQNHFKKGTAIINYKSGYTYSGEMENEKFHGLGVLRISINGFLLRVIADWQEGMPIDFHKNAIQDQYNLALDNFKNALENLLVLEGSLEFKHHYFNKLLHLFKKTTKEKSLLDSLRKLQNTGDDEKANACSNAANQLLVLHDARDKLKAFNLLIESVSYQTIVKDICSKGLRLHKNRLLYVIETQVVNPKYLELIKSLLERFLNDSSIEKTIQIQPGAVNLIVHLANTSDNHLQKVSQVRKETVIERYHEFIKITWDSYLSQLAKERETKAYEAQDWRLYGLCYQQHLQIESKCSELRQQAQDDGNFDEAKLQVYVALAQAFIKVLNTMQPWSVQGLNGELVKKEVIKSLKISKKILINTCARGNISQGYNNVITAYQEMLDIKGINDINIQYGIIIANYFVSFLDRNNLKGDHDLKQKQMDSIITFVNANEDIINIIRLYIDCNQELSTLFQERKELSNDVRKDLKLYCKRILDLLTVTARTLS